jgi:hypothetical protein
MLYGMSRKKVFKTKTFDRWAKKLLPDSVLCAAARGELKEICNAQAQQ